MVEKVFDLNQIRADCISLECDRLSFLCTILGGASTVVAKQKSLLTSNQAALKKSV